MPINRHLKKISIYTKRNCLTDNLSKKYISRDFFRWISKTDPNTIHDMYKLLKQYNNERNKKIEKLRKNYILPRSKSEPIIKKRYRLRHSMSEPVIYTV